jgi:hypothetical protein
MSSDAARTKLVVGAAGEAKDAMTVLARAAEPRAAARRLALADHVHVAGAIHTAAFYLAYALQHDANGIQYCYGEHGERDRGLDLQRVLIRAGTHVRQAADKAGGACEAIRADAGAAGQKPHMGTSSLPLRRASLRASRAIEAMGVAFRDPATQYGVRLAGYEQVTEWLGEMTGDLLSVFSHEAMLLDGVYEDAGKPRRASRAAGPLASGLSDLRLAGRGIAVASVTLRDDVAVGIRRTRRRSA